VLRKHCRCEVSKLKEKTLRGVLITIISSVFFGCATQLQTAAQFDKLTYHNDPHRSGWNNNESILTPRAVASPAFGLLWRSEAFDLHEQIPPRLYATPLYVDKVEFARRGHRKENPVLYAVASTAYVYAVNAFATSDLPAGAILWRVRLTQKPCSGGTFGSLSTPIIDLERRRLYVTSCDEVKLWRAHALDIRNGEQIDGWPVEINREAVNAPGVSKNGYTQYPETPGNVQRGALNLSPDGLRLYVTFGGEAGGAGWIVVLDTIRPRVASAFSATAVTEENQGGIWASGGPAIDRGGRIHVTTGASAYVVLKKLGLPGVFPKSPNNWGQSMIQLEDNTESGLELVGTYTPFNYCQASMADIDLGSSGITVIDLDPNKTSTPHLLAFGGKQGNVYLLDRAHLPGDLVRRQPCSDDPTSDKSMLAPESQPHFGSRGPINVFGPYSDLHGMENQARSRSTPAYLETRDGRSFIFVSGSAKTGDNLLTSVPPGLARLEIVTSPGRPAYLRLDQLELSQTFKNPGSPVVTSNAGADAVVWVLDMNAAKSTSLYGAEAPNPILYAFDALTFELLWKSALGAMETSGKYNEPTIVRGTVFVGTDRIVAFGLGARNAPEGARDKGVQNISAVAERLQAEELGEHLYGQRCAGCHSSGQPGVPQRSALAALDRNRIFRALEDGAMRSQALGLSEMEKRALAAYLSSSD
jgi:outer membrane protein assembly factor BamB